MAAQRWGGADEARAKRYIGPHGLSVAKAAGAFLNRSSCRHCLSAFHTTLFFECLSRTSRYERPLHSDVQEVGFRTGYPTSRGNRVSVVFTKVDRCKSGLKKGEWTAEKRELLTPLRAVYKQVNVALFHSAKAHHPRNTLRPFLRADLPLSTFVKTTETLFPLDAGYRSQKTSKSDVLGRRMGRSRVPVQASAKRHARRRGSAG